MFCRNCGNELKNNEEFCPKCGTKSTISSSENNVNISVDDIKKKSVEILNVIISKLNDLGKNGVLALANTILLVLSLIFANTETLTVNSILGISQSESMYSDIVFIRVIFIVLYLLAIFVLAFPLFTKKKFQQRHFIPSIIVSALSITWFIIIIAVGMSELKSDSFSASLVKFKISGTGWLFLITTISSIITSVLNFIKVKRSNSHEPIPSENINEM